MAANNVCSSCEEDIDSCDCDYCAICNEYTMEYDNCRHIFWDERGWLGGPGSDLNASAYTERYADEVLRLARRVGCARALRHMLRRSEALDLKTFDGVVTVSYEVVIGGRDFSQEFNKLDGSYSNAANWLRALDRETPAANAATLVWIEAEVARQDLRRASGERCYVVRRGRERLSEPESWGAALARLKSMPRGGWERPKIVHVRAQASEERKQ